MYWNRNTLGMNWLLPENVNLEEYVGFVYKITNLKNNKYYIGKKFFWYNKKKKLTKKQLAEQTGPGRKSTTEIVKTEKIGRAHV